MCRNPCTLRLLSYHLRTFSRPPTLSGMRRGGQSVESAASETRLCLPRLSPSFEASEVGHQSMVRDGLLPVCLPQAHSLCLLAMQPTGYASINDATTVVRETNAGRQSTRALQGWASMCVRPTGFVTVREDW